jgi:hypothetical protein
VSHGVKGEWTSYSVDVKQEGDYKIVLSYSSGSATPTGKLHLEMDDVSITPEYTLPGTGSYATYKDFDGPVVHLTAGLHILKHVDDNAGYNLYKIKFIAQ